MPAAPGLMQSGCRNAGHLVNFSGLEGSLRDFTQAPMELQSDSVSLILLALLCPWGWGVAGTKLGLRRLYLEEK